LTTPKKILPRIAAVSAGAKPMTLARPLGQGRTEPHRRLEPGGNVPRVGAVAPFAGIVRQVRLGERGRDVVWNDEIDMAADTLWRLAQEQWGLTMSPDAFRRWP
jgi:hypothetical protein